MSARKPGNATFANCCICGEDFPDDCKEISLDHPNGNDIIWSGEAPAAIPVHADCWLKKWAKR